MSSFSVTSLNINGIRAGQRKGFYDWLSHNQPDVVCLQEIKAQVDQLRDLDFFPKGYHAFFHSAEKKGYSGVAIYSRRQPDRVEYGIGWPKFDSEGRYIRADFGNLSIVSLYLPSGSAKDERQDYKMEILADLEKKLAEWRETGREWIICGDWNIAHTKLDIKNWRGNQKSSGFLPEERAWMDQLFGPLGYVDTFRVVRPEDEQYTWWSNRGQAWDNNTGWRIDYQVATAGIGKRVQSAEVYTENRFSDHSPLTMHYDGEL